MRYRYFWVLGVFLPLLANASIEITRVDEKDLYFGEAYFYASQDNYVDAIARQDIARGRYYGAEVNWAESLHKQVGNSRYAAGDLESSYRMYRRAEAVLKTIVESNADQLVRNEAAFLLAGILMQQGEVENALKVIEKISGKIPENIHEDEIYLRSQIYMAKGDFAGALRSLQKLQNSNSYNGIAAYNLGIALIKIGQEKQGLDQLEKAGKTSGDDEFTLSLRDKANWTLGSRLIGNQKPELAKQFLERVRLTGPYSNKALLGLGWADVAMGRYDSALAPWLVLAKRNASDKAVLESMMGVPYAYAKLNLPGKAARLYGKALEEFDRELIRLDTAIKRVSEGKFLKDVLGEALKQDINVIKNKSLVQAPETDYLFDLMASRDFQQLLNNYRDLYDLAIRLEFWEENPSSAIRLSPPASRNFPEYDNQLRQIKSRVHDARQKVSGLMSEHSHLLETMSLNELNRRRMHIQELQSQARFGLTDSYERASKLKATSSGVK